jgi:hypothetical protein
MTSVRLVFLGTVAITTLSRSTGICGVVLSMNLMMSESSFAEGRSHTTRRLRGGRITAAVVGLLCSQSFIREIPASCSDGRFDDGCTRLRIACGFS